MALAEYERKICDCGFHESLHDTANTFKPEHRVCPIMAGAGRYQRMLAEYDEKWPKDAPARQQRPWDGRRVFMRLMPPGEAASRVGSPSARKRA